jgi:uncharacterized protein YjiS (DUF1127 family)
MPVEEKRRFSSRCGSKHEMNGRWQFALPLSTAAFFWITLHECVPSMAHMRRRNLIVRRNKGICTPSNHDAQKLGTPITWQNRDLIMSMNHHNDYIGTRAGVMAAALSGMSAGISAMTSGWNQRSQQRRLTAELSKLTDRELADIGLHRADIATVTCRDLRIEGPRVI